MTDQERRAEILKAEEAVRLLAQELAEAMEDHREVEKTKERLANAQAALEHSASLNRSAIQQATEEATRRLAAAQATLDQSERTNRGVVQALDNCAREARGSLQEAKNRLETLGGQVTRGICELQATVERLEKLPSLLQDTLEHGLRLIFKGMDSLQREHEQMAEKSRHQLLWIRRLTFTLVLLGLLSAGSLASSLILLLNR